MGKTYRSFEKSEAFDYHDSEQAYRKKKSKANRIKSFLSVHKDRKADLLDKLDSREDEE